MRLLPFVLLALGWIWLARSVERGPKDAPNLGKRLRVLKAALTQRWLEKHCTACHRTFYCMADWWSWDTQTLCMPCEERAFSKWLTVYGAAWRAKERARTW